jgi:hypothetical protein
MNDFELESKLKTVPVPARSEDYWENFPSQVRANLRRAPVEFAPQNFWLLRPAWGGCFALTVALVFVCVQFHPLQTISLAIMKQQRHFHTQLVRLDTGLHVLMLNTDGMGYLLAEAN